ncbi:hypothetical protein Bbelb_307590 [Branchiostoma belcheri]|nr:hypothetical protein Bbelb_307590 [Branchiostoma belcheri]
MAESSDRALTEGQIKQISSAYIKWFTTVSPTTHPTPDFDNSALTSDTYTLNRNGDNRLPCGRPLLAVNVSERVRPQRTEKDKVSPTQLPPEKECVSGGMMGLLHNGVPARVITVENIIGNGDLRQEEFRIGMVMKQTSGAELWLFSAHVSLALWHAGILANFKLGFYATLPEYQSEWYEVKIKLRHTTTSDTCHPTPQVSEVTVTSRNFRQLRTTSDTCHPTPQVSEVTVTSRNFRQLQTPATLPHKCRKLQ